MGQGIALDSTDDSSNEGTNLLMMFLAKTDGVKTPTGRDSKSGICYYMTKQSNRKLLCHLCNKDFKFHGSTSTHTTHLLRVHPTHVDFSNEKSPSRSRTNSLSDNCSSPTYPPKFLSKKRTEEITKAIIARIIMLDMRTASTANGYEFYSVFQAAEPSY